jgi:hypothetical protein
MSGQSPEAPPGHSADGHRRAGVAAHLTRFVPMLSWARAYQAASLTKDVIAGLTIWGLLVPEMIAYASLAGLPPQAPDQHGAPESPVLARRSHPDSHRSRRT